MNNCVINNYHRWIVLRENSIYQHKLFPSIFVLTDIFRIFQDEWNERSSAEERYEDAYQGLSRKYTVYRLGVNLFVIWKVCNRLYWHLFSIVLVSVGNADVICSWFVKDSKRGSEMEHQQLFKCQGSEFE